jgi:hypothetical protein
MIVMVQMKRRSAVQFNTSVVKSETRDDWTVILAYEGEGEGPWLVDLGHKTRWDLQDGGIDDQRPCGLAVPSRPGACLLKDGVLINRMNRTQAAVWHLGQRATVIPASPGYTDVTDATVFLALFGFQVFRITEKLTDLDFLDSNKTVPFLLQGPFSGVSCQLVTLSRAKGEAGAILLTCARGYARDMVHAILSAGEPHGLRPAGETRFVAWLDGRTGSDSDPDS